MDRLTKKERSLLMSKIRVSGTDIEEYLGECVRVFWSKERYSKNPKAIVGKPDIVFKKSKVAVFADGDFWHGRSFQNWEHKLPDFWKKKIRSNIGRDRRYGRTLRKQGFKVLRFWGSEIKKHPDRVREKIGRALEIK